LSVPHVHAAPSFSFKPVPARAQETNTAQFVLILNVTGATLATNYQFTWFVTDPAGTIKNHANSTTALSSSFWISLQYPRDFTTSIVYPGNYTVSINQNQPSAISGIAGGQFQVGLTDKPAYQRTNNVSIKATGYANNEQVTINIYQGLITNSAPGYPTNVPADSTGQFSTSWLTLLSSPSGTWTVSLTGASTTKVVPDRQNFVLIPLNLTISQFALGQVTIQRTQTQSVTFSATYPGGSTVQTGSAKIKLSEPNGTAHLSTATYNSTYAKYRASYTIPPSSLTGNWTLAMDVGMFDDGNGNTGPTTKIVLFFRVYPTNVTISQLQVSQTLVQRTQTMLYSFTAQYLNGLPVQTGSALIRVTESDGTTTFNVVTAYNSTASLFQAVSKIPANGQTGAWVASLDPASFNDGYGNGGPSSSIVRGFTVESASLTVLVTAPNQTFSLGQVMPIYATVVYPDGTLVTSGTLTVSFSLSGNPTGSPVTLVYVQGQSRWAGSYVVQSNDISGLWLATVKATDDYGNTGQQTQSVIVSVPTNQGASPMSLALYWFLVSALVVGSGGSGLVLLRRFNVTQAPFDDLFSLTGGEFSPATSLMILGETAGSGTTTLSLELIHRHLASGKPAALIEYDAFPSETQRVMQSFGWDVTSNLQNGSFKILDCFSALAGAEHPPIRDPLDFTEISIQVSKIIEETAGRGPILIALDSLAPIFNGATPATTINFLRVLSAKVKASNGILIITGARGSIPQSVWSSLENLVDGMLVLGAVQKGDSLIRTLTVKRLAGRKTSHIPAEFEIVAGKGIAFLKPRIPIKILTPKKIRSRN
jgi:KaiC/GvpD/RAD55 family RecA-like ATPase